MVTVDLGAELARAGAGAPVALPSRGNRVRVTPAARRSRADGANRVEIRRPAGVAVGLRVGAGAADVGVDGVRLDGSRGVAWGDPVLLSAADHPDRYDIQVAGGVARLVVA